jgi:G:T-mismatch repair DNA endonuclease (very short patch repair protein)
MKKRSRKIKKVLCKICNKEYSIVGMYTHLKHTHEMTVDEYVLKYGEYRPKYLDYNKRSNENNIICGVCGKDNFASHRHFSHHIRVDHDLDMVDYVQKYIFNNQPQLCECGCGQEVSLLKRPPYRRDFISGHNENPMSGSTHSEESRNAMSKVAMSRGLPSNKTNTKPELELINKLEGWGIQYETQCNTEFGVIDFYLPDYDVFLEVDGEYFHPINFNNLTIKHLNSIRRDFVKNNNIHNLIRIRSKDISKLETFFDLFLLDAKDFYPSSIGYTDILLSKDYLKHCHDNKRSGYVNDYIHTMWYCIKTLSPNFPRIQTSETVEKVVASISHKIEAPKNKVFRNSVSSTGSSLLKSIFNSYWKSSYKGKKSPVDAWKDDSIMKKIVEYRVGVNKQNEIYNLSLRNVVRGLHSNRYSVSFFKPLLAANIYRYFLKDNKSPVVFDPCAGFGGRLLGFKSVYPDGTYIGLEPNIETYRELLRFVELSSFSNVYIFNVKLEDYDIGGEHFDLAFTSIPYFDLETYSNPVKYLSIGDWEELFIGKLLQIPRLLVNIPTNMRHMFPDIAEEFFIESPSSHFTKKEKTKKEYLLYL